MNILQSRSGQRTVSAWTMLGSLLIVCGVAGLGVAFIKPSSLTPGAAAVATGNSAAAPLSGENLKTGRPGDIKPAVPTVTNSPELGDSKSDALGAAKSTTSGAGAIEVTKIETPPGGPHPNWHGTWRGAKPDAPMVITATRVGDCKWINATEPRFDSDCESGYAKSSVSLADISRSYEKSVALFQHDPSDFSISDPAQSRRLIGRIKPGNYRVIWMDGGSDCGRQQLVIDGDVILGVVECKYQHQISLFTREGVAPPANNHEVQGAVGRTVVSPLPGGR